MNTIMAWVEAHPVLFNTVLWPLISAIALLLFKPRTPDEYARMNPRVAGFLIFLSGLGLDIPKALEGLKRMLTGKAIPIDAARARDLLETAVVVPKKPVEGDSSPPPTTMGPAVLILIALGFGQGCATTQAKQAAAESTYLTEQLQCVDRAKTLEESKVCRDEVKARWAAKDAGAAQ